jgi:cytochrome oxidase Cu insertion factor (SCO1/SenC/PrrC family)
VRHVPGRSGGLVGAAMLLAVLAACGGGSVKPPPPSLGTVVNFAVPAAIANIPLTKPDGSTTTLAAYRGKTVMIADFLSLCTDICPLISANTAAVARALNADGERGKVALLEISVDPQRDTPARLTAYQKLYGQPVSDWTLLRATPANTTRLWKYFGVDYGRTKEQKPPSIDWLTGKPLTYDVYHSDDLIFLDPSGHQRFIVNADPDVQGHNPPSKLVKFLDPQGLTSLNRPNPVGDWTVSQGVSVFSWLLDQKLAAPQ